MFRPCIDLRGGKVTQIVGGTLADDPSAVKTNFVTDRPSRWFAELYRQDGLLGGHVVMLGPGNEAAARDALAAYPHGLQLGGGINPENARSYLDAGASHVIVTSWIFVDGRLAQERLERLVEVVGRDRLVLDLSCRSRRDTEYIVVTDRFQRFTQMRLSRDVFHSLAQHCAEFLVHAVDKEGLCQGIDQGLVEKLADWSPIPVTYAGGAKTLQDLEDITRLGRGRIDLTIGSALDLFGGTGVRYRDAVAFNRRLRT